MNDEYTEKADELIGSHDEAIYDEMERDARRYNRAFTEEEEASMG